MNPERFARLKEIVVTALRLREEERGGYLDSVCESDPALRREAEELLGQGETAAGGIRTAGVDRLVETLFGEGAGGSGPAPGVPDSVGPYRVLGVLGEGGMGVVYRAEQTEPIRREVALKLIKGSADSASVLARFDTERQSLAAMDHPNIATVLDAGSDDGRPYFVMELIRGVPITDYCSECRLDLPQRLRLFLDVCRAVRHAHRRGIIHRDLKPSNILVTEVGGEPVPKVIDFSIAKALDDPSLGTDFRTRTGQLLGTLEYMSPEQARGETASVDTRSDVYALGVVLHELLAQRLPYDLKGLALHEAVRCIAEESPERLRDGTTGTRTERDVEILVGKCLEKEPDRRYGSAAELAEDVGRYLDSRPILARPPTATYQLGTLIRRHRIAFGVAAGAFVLLTAFAATVSVQLGIQRRERARAEAAAAEARREARRAGRVTEFMQEMLASAAPTGTNTDITVRQVLDETAERIDRDLAGEPESLADAHHTLGVTYAGLGDPDAGLEHLRRALELHEQTTGAVSKDVASDRRAMANVLYAKGLYDEASVEGRRALEWWRSAPDAGEGATPPEVIALLRNLAVIESSRGDLDEAERLVRQAVEKAEPHDPATRAEARQALAFVLWRRGDDASSSEAETQVRDVVKIEREFKGPDHPDTLRSLNLLATVVNQLGRHEEATRIHYEVLLRRRRTLDADHPQIAVSANNLATDLLDSGYLAAAAPYQEEALRIWQSVHGDDHPFVIVALSNKGFMLHGLGRLDEAERVFRDAAARAERQQDPARRRAVQDLLMHLLRDRGERLDEAETYARANRERFPPDPDSPTRQQGWAAGALGFVLLEQGRIAEAEDLFQEAIDVLQGLGRPGLGASLGLALSISETEGREAALPFLTPVEEQLLSGRPWPPNHVRYHLRKIAELRESWGDTDEAEAARAERVRRLEASRAEPDLTAGLDPEILATLETSP